MFVGWSSQMHAYLGAAFIYKSYLKFKDEELSKIISKLKVNLFINI